MINNNSNIKIIPMEPHSIEWYAYRMNGIGGSDAGSILGLNRDVPAIMTYYEKIGRKEPWTQESQPAFHGQNLEKYVRKLWTHFDGTEEGYINNYREGKRIRATKNVGGYVINKKYPWLFASLDGLMKAGGYRLDNLEPMGMDCPLECKTMSQMVEAVWESGIPPTYFAQVHLYMLLTETDYSEIVTLIDNRKLKVTPVPFSEKFGNLILEETKKFWYERVVPAKKAVENQIHYDRNNDYIRSSECEEIIHSMEPPPDNSDEYKKFLSEKASVEDNDILATDTVFSYASMHKVFEAVEKMAKSYKQNYENRIIKFMHDNNVQVIKMGNAGTITWRPRRKGGHTFRNNYEYGPSEDVVRKEWDKMDLEKLE